MGRVYVCCYGNHGNMGESLTCMVRPMVSFQMGICSCCPKIQLRKPRLSKVSCRRWSPPLRKSTDAITLCNGLVALCNTFMAEQDYMHSLDTPSHSPFRPPSKPCLLRSYMSHFSGNCTFGKIDSARVWPLSTIPVRRSMQKC